MMNDDDDDEDDDDDDDDDYNIWSDHGMFALLFQEICSSVFVSDSSSLVGSFSRSLLTDIG